MNAPHTHLFPQQGPTSPRTFLLRYPVPYNEAPFLTVTAVGTNPALPDKFKFVVRRIGAHSALVAVQRNDPGVSTFALWTQSFTAQWKTRAFPSGKDITQFGSRLGHVFFFRNPYIS